MMVNFADVFGKDDERERKEGWAPGNYTGECHKCGERFIGDKRASECADCAYVDVFERLMES